MTPEETARRIVEDWQDAVSALGWIDREMTDLANRIAAALREARKEERERASNLLRHPSSDMLNRAADDMRREFPSLQQRAKILLDAVADQIDSLKAR